jgi:anthranilate/para-aminobenzoate synthase component II
VLHDGSDLLRAAFAARGHALSLAHRGTRIPARDLIVTAVAQDDASEIHAVRHREHPVWGVQFHPESVMTPRGKDILANFLRLAAVPVVHAPA